MYWLRLLKNSNILDNKESNSLMTDCDELLKIIGTIIKTMKVKLSQ
jgi:four helix bundle protein